MYMLSYMARNIYFIKAFDGSLIPYLTSDDIDYFTINKLSAKYVLLSLFSKQYQSKAMEYILSIALKKYFEKSMYNQKKAQIMSITV